MKRYPHITRKEVEAVISGAQIARRHKVGRLGKYLNLYIKTGSYYTGEETEKENNYIKKAISITVGTVSLGYIKFTCTNKNSNEWPNIVCAQCVINNALQTLGY